MMRMGRLNETIIPILFISYQKIATPGVRERERERESKETETVAAYLIWPLWLMMMIMMLSKEYEVAVVLVVIWVRGRLEMEYTLKEPQKWILNFFCAAQIFLMFS